MSDYRTFEYTISGEAENRFHKEKDPTRKEEIRQEVLKLRLFALDAWVNQLGKPMPDNMHWEKPKNIS